MKYNVYYETRSNWGRSYCARGVSYERANRLFNSLVANWGDDDSFLCAGIHRVEHKHIDIRHYRA